MTALVSLVVALLLLWLALWTVVARDAFVAVAGFVVYGLLLSLVWVRLAGIDVTRVLISVYAVAGLIYAIGGWVQLGRSLSASSNAAAAAKTLASWNFLPTISMPTGRPSTRPVGTLALGNPVKFVR